ncbi:MAG TPA: nicotinamide riboside transporter PnuC [Bacteroidia bacterium]|nr:nicotinamide riboside transporter PnuC [Bacteroidia bacterium]
MSSSIYSSIVDAIVQTTFIEWLIFIMAMAYVILAAIENVWCWLFGILASVLSVYLCYSGNLFLESGLQVFYVIIGIYGWYEWLHGSKNKTELPIISYSLTKIFYLILIGIIIWIPFGYIARNYSTQALPYLDAYITAFSIVATWMTAKKIIQNWIFWIVIDALAVFLYASRSFYLIALLYSIYTVLSILGYFQWKRKIHPPSGSL